MKYLTFIFLTIGLSASAQITPNDSIPSFIKGLKYNIEHCSDSSGEYIVYIIDSPIEVKALRNRVKSFPVVHRSVDNNLLLIIVRTWEDWEIMTATGVGFRQIQVYPMQ